jgi:hypothetical protein
MCTVVGEPDVALSPLVGDVLLPSEGFGGGQGVEYSAASLEQFQLCNARNSRLAHFAALEVWLLKPMASRRRACESCV